jgi:hypothetical protein
MKRSPEDFKDKLAGRQDKVAAVKEIKHDLAGAGLVCKTTRRKLATGVKIYFTVSPPDSVSMTKSWYDNVGSVRNYSVDTIAKHFPSASVTSGGPSGWTISEY